MAYLEQKRTAKAYDLVSSFVVTSVPYFDANGNYQYGSGYMSAPQKIGEANFTTYTGVRNTSGTPGFMSGTALPPIKAAAYTHTKETMYAEGFEKVYYINVDSPGKGPGSSGYRPSDNWSVNKFQYPFGTIMLDSWSASVRDKATRNLLASIKNSSVNLAVASAERKQTMDLIASTATRIAKAGMALKKGQFSKAAQNLGITPKKRAGRRFNRDYPVDQAKAVSNAWLELQYGWKPLLSDVYGSAKALAEARTGTNMIYIKRTGYASRAEKTTSRSNWLSNSSSVKGVWYTVSDTKQKVFVKTGVTYAISSPRVNDAKQLGFTNPLLVAWEVVPFSFVVDWFLPIGNYLDSLDATLGLSFYDGYVSTKGEYESTNNTIIAWTQNSYEVHNGTKTEFRKVERFTRTLLGGFPSAPLPTFKNPLSKSHVASALALLFQTFKR
jgi:hypothetical protein